MYNGKELADDFGLDWHFYGARMYDAAIGRFPSVDPIADQFAFVSPFNYAENEPVGHIDLWGLQQTKADEPKTTSGPLREGYIYSDGPSSDANKEPHLLRERDGSEQYHDMFTDLNTKNTNLGIVFSAATMAKNGDQIADLLANHKHLGFLIGAKEGLLFDMKNIPFEVNKTSGSGKMTGKELIKQLEALGGKSLNGSIATYNIKQTGKYLFWMGAGLGAIDGYMNIQEGKYREATVNGVDIGMGALGAFSSNPVGGGISLGWFTVQFLGNTINNAYYERGGGNFTPAQMEMMKKEPRCFVKGTKVLLKDFSEINIEEVKVGQEILSVDTKNMSLELDTVLVITSVPVEHKVVRIELENKIIIECSPHHPFFIKDKGLCAFDVEMAKNELPFEVKQMEEGDIVFSYVDSKLEEKKIKSIKLTNEKSYMYNLEHVKRNNTFFANKVLVHNKYKN